MGRLRRFLAGRLARFLVEHGDLGELVEAVAAAARVDADDEAAVAAVAVRAEAYEPEPTPWLALALPSASGGGGGGIRPPLERYHLHAALIATCLLAGHVARRAGRRR